MIARRVLNVFLFVLVFTACGASQREKTLKVTFAAINTARSGFLVHDDAQQAAIVAKATSLEEGKTQLTTYRLARVEVVEAFELAYRTLATAVLLNDDASVKNAAQALARLLEIIDRVRGVLKA